MIIEIVKLVIYSILIVLIAKYVLVTLLRKLGEVINLKPDTIGNIAGIATSIPELLTVSISAFAGLSSTSAYNIISSNIINFVQYISAIYMNKNQSRRSFCGCSYALLRTIDTLSSKFSPTISCPFCSA